MVWERVENYMSGGVMVVKFSQHRIFKLPPRATGPQPEPQQLLMLISYRTSSVNYEFNDLIPETINHSR